MKNFLFLIIAFSTVYATHAGDYTPQPQLHLLNDYNIALIRELSKSAGRTMHHEVIRLVRAVKACGRAHPAHAHGHEARPLLADEHAHQD